MVVNDDDDVYGRGIGGVDNHVIVPLRFIVDSALSTSIAIVTPPRSVLTVQPPSYYLSNTTFQRIVVKYLRGTLQMESELVEGEIE